MANDRRSFLKNITLTGAGAFALSQMNLDGFNKAFAYFEPMDIKNPLAAYPDREWEKVYRDLWKYDSEFSFLCAPNDTHNCLLTAHVKNNTIVRIAPSYGFSKAGDLQGNTASARWEPRCCQKGLALSRRFYGDRRIKYPVIREGYLQWIKDGFPREKNGRIPLKYVQRGKEAFVKISWDEIFQYAAKAYVNIATTYTGKEGSKLLEEQGYDKEMVEATHGQGVQTLKFRGGMAALGVTRIFAMNRLANSFALLDSKIRGVGPDEAHGARGWDSYAWHTDLPPGHPMVTGQQTVDFDLSCVEYSNNIIVWGMNWITTKMPDAHWLTEARLKGAKVTVIACEYSATSNKADNVLIVRPGVTPALALGFANVIINEKLYDAEYISKYTDMPFLVRMDTQQFLKPNEVDKEYKLKDLTGYIKVMKTGEKPDPSFKQPNQYVTEELRNEWGDFMIWDSKKNAATPICRDDYGKTMVDNGFSPVLEGSFKVKLADGKEIEVRPVFDLIKKYVVENFDPQTVEEMTWAPKDGILSIARDIAKNSGSTLFCMGMGPNQMFNNDLKDRTVLLLAALTKNIGRVGGNVGSFAGNYRAAFFSGIPSYILENPFNIQMDPTQPSEIKKYFSYESAHYFNSGDKILKMGDNVITGKTHMPTPTKSILVSNGNSLLGNSKGHYENLINVYPKIELIGVCDWWWTASCENADIVFPVDSWGEFKSPDATMSVTNPFLYIYPRTPMQRIFDTKGDIEVVAGIAKALGTETGDNRFVDYFKFSHEGKPEVYLQRVFNASPTTKGFKVEELEANAQKGIPALLMSRTYPKYVGYEQTEENKQWYTKTGRMEFFRDEKEFKAAGETIPIHREPIDSTFYEPNVIVSKSHPSINPTTPDQYGVSKDNLSTDVRQGRNVVKPWTELKLTTHPLTKQDSKFKFIFHTPKYRHGAHTTPVDTDILAVWFGPYGDIHRTDKRMPYVTEMYIDINPLDAKELGLEDGDYCYVDADPQDRPFRGWQDNKDSEEYKLARLMVRVRYYPGTPRGVTRMWHNAYGATFGSIRGAKINPTGLAKNPLTNYQAMFRFGSHQSCTRGWLKPTWMTDSLVRKNHFGQQIAKGFELDVHGATGAPRESFVKIEFAEKGGLNGEGNWRPTDLKIRPTYESDDFKKFMQGGFVKV